MEFFAVLFFHKEFTRLNSEKNVELLFELEHEKPVYVIYKA